MSCNHKIMVFEQCLIGVCRCGSGKTVQFKIINGRNQHEVVRKPGGDD